MYGVKPQDVESSYENDKQAFLPKLNAHAQNDLVLVILLRYIPYSRIAPGELMQTSLSLSLQLTRHP